MNIALTSEMTQLADTMRRYAVASGRTEREVVQKKSKDLSFKLKKGLKLLSPARGAIRTERLLAMSRGEGVKVRAAVYESVVARYGAVTSLASGKTYLEVNSKGGRAGKKVAAMSTGVVDRKSGAVLGLQSLAIQAELAVRESGRGFSARAVPKVPNEFTPGEFDIESRYGFTLSQLRLSESVEGFKATFRWLGRKTDSYSDAAEALQTAKQMAVLTEAIAEVRADTEEYIKRKSREDIRTHFHQ